MKQHIKVFKNYRACMIMPAYLSAMIFQVKCTHPSVRKFILFQMERDHNFCKSYKHFKTQEGKCLLTTISWDIAVSRILIIWQLRLLKHLYTNPFSGYSNKRNLNQFKTISPIQKYINISNCLSWRTLKEKHYPVSKINASAVQNSSADTRAPSFQISLWTYK